MFKENKFTTILFILIFGCLIGLLIYTPFYLKDYNKTLNEQHQNEKAKKEEAKQKEELKEEPKKEPVSTATETKEEQKKEEPKEPDKENVKVEPINLKLTIEVNGKKYPATLVDNETTRAFIKKLPLEVTMKELNGNEKYYTFNEKLPSNPISIKQIEKGDLMLYEDNTLVLFYESFNTPYSYTKIGNISDKDNGMLKTNLNKNSKVKFYQ